MGYWYDLTLGTDNIAVSTRVRIARNLTDFSFPSRMNEAQKGQLCEKIKNVIANSNSEILSNLKYINLSDVPESERYALFERHIISKEFATNPKNRSIIISGDESVSIMIGEEDHIRIQVISGGFCPEKTYKTANDIEVELSKILSFAYDKNLGYLTECPTNLGTGIRVSAMLHLPLISANAKVSGLAESLSKIGFTIRGMYGEGTKALSNFYQVSNQITLGITEENAIKNLTSIVEQILNLEKTLRDNVNTLQIEDKTSRALYTLKGAKILSSAEMMNLLSDVMLGINLGIINENSLLPLKVLIECSPNMLNSKYGEKTPMERDVLRAKIISESIVL